MKSVINEVKDHPSAITMLTDIFITDDYTFQHSFNVAVYATTTGVKLGFSEKQLNELGIGAMLHDVGKVNILKKEERLTTEEYEEVQMHAWLGFEYIRKKPTTRLLSHTAHISITSE